MAAVKISDHLSLLTLKMWKLYFLSPSLCLFGCYWLYIFYYTANTCSLWGVGMGRKN